MKISVSALYPKRSRVEFVNSGITWLPVAPKRWRRIALKQLARFQSGEAITGDEIKSDGQYKVYGGNGLRGFTHHFTHSGRHILIGRQGALCGNVILAEDRFWASEHAIVLHPLKDFDERWLKHLLQTMNLNQYSLSAAQPGLSAGYISSLQVPLPSPEEQDAIGNFLETEIARVDVLVAKQKQLIKLLKEKRQAVISQAVTKGLDPAVPMKDSGVQWLGEVPAHWMVAPMKMLAVVQTGIAKGKAIGTEHQTTIPYLRVANVQDGFISLDDVQTLPMARGDVSRYLLRAGDVLMNEGGDFDKLGRGAVWDGSIDPCVHQNHVFAVRPTRVEPSWLATAVSSRYMKFYFMALSKQSTNLASISSTNLMMAPVAVPPVEERRAILEFIAILSNRIDASMSKAEEAVVLLDERRTALVSAAVTGQIDVIAHESVRDAADTASAA